jgi:Ca2+-binding EF-hand superfamily protein
MKNINVDKFGTIDRKETVSLTSLMVKINENNKIEEAFEIFGNSKKKLL